MTEEIQQKSREVKALMLEKFPNTSNTIMIYIWDDGDFKVECRYGSGEGKIYTISYHKFSNQFDNMEEYIPYDAMKIDEFGNKIYVTN